MKFVPLVVPVGRCSTWSTTGIAWRLLTTGRSLKSAGLSGTRSFKTIAVRESSRVYSLETIDDPDLIEDRIYEVLKVQGIDSANIRLEFSDTTMLVENFEI